MDLLKKNKILIGAVVLLLLLNIGVITFMFVTRPPNPRGPRDQRRDQVARFIDDELQLNSDQRTQYRKLQEELFARTDSIMKVRAEAMEEMYQLLKGETPDPATMREKAAQIGATETERSVSTWEHFRALRALCTAEQRQKFDKIILDVLRQVRGPELQGGPAGPQGGPPPQGGLGPQGGPPPQGGPEHEQGEFSEPPPPPPPPERPAD